MRSFGSVLAGFVLWSILWFVFGMVVRAIHPEVFAEDGSTQSVPILVLYLVASLLITLASGWLTAKLASRAKVSHAVALGVVLLAVGILVQTGYWNVLPVWYHLSFLALLLPMAALGGRIIARD